MPEMIETRFGPADVQVFPHGGISLSFKQSILIHRVEYRSVQIWHSTSHNRSIVEAIGYGPQNQNLTPSAQKALTAELERVRLTYATAEPIQAAARTALEFRVQRLVNQVKDAEEAWHRAQSELEAATAALAEHPALDRPAA